MKEKIPTPLVIGAIVIVVIGALYFGWHAISGGPDADVTQASIKHWQEVKANSHPQTSRDDAAKMGAPVSGGPAGAPATSGGTR